MLCFNKHLSRAVLLTVLQVSIRPLPGGRPHVDWQCLFLFDVLVTFLLRRVRGIDVRQKFIFGVSLLLNSIFSA